MFGILNLHKPQGMTSRDVVNVVQRIVKPVKVGHAGTLDPMATGVLLVALGKATKLISRLQQSPKTYVADFVLGQRSDTDDATGAVENVPTEAVFTAQQVEDALQTFVGTIEQVPPAFSAVKVNGQRAYTKARRGEDVTLKAKPVTVYGIQLQQFDWPRLRVTIECGSGTYIRSIARDLGTQLGCGGLMSALERTAIGRFSVEDAIDPQSLSADNLASQLANPIDVVAGVAQYRCTEHDESEIVLGRNIVAAKTRWVQPYKTSDTEVALVSSDATRLLAMAEYDAASQRLQPRTVFVSKAPT